MYNVSDYGGFDDKPGEYFKYWYALEDGHPEHPKDVVFYAFSREDADKQYEKLTSKAPTKFLRREKW